MRSYLLLFLIAGPVLGVYSLYQPENVTLLDVENRSPECPFSHEFNPGGVFSNTTLQLSYSPSPFSKLLNDSTSKSNVSITCHSIMRVTFNAINYTLSAVQASFRQHMSLDEGMTAGIEMTTVWRGDNRSQMYNWETLAVPGPSGQDLNFISHNKTFDGTVCQGDYWEDWYITHIWNIWTTFSLDGDVKPNPQWDMPFEQRFTFTWDKCPLVGPEFPNE